MAGYRPKRVLPLKIQLTCGDCIAILLTLFKKYLPKVEVYPNGYQHNIRVKVCVLYLAIYSLIGHTLNERSSVTDLCLGKRSNKTMFTKES